MRISIRDLAVAGAPPNFQTSLHVDWPNIGDRLMQRVDDLLDRRWPHHAGVYVDGVEPCRVERLLAECSV